MPLFDHFRPPLSERRHGEAFHTRWASAIADDLNATRMPAHLFAEPTVQIGGQVQVDVSTFDENSGTSAPTAVGTVARTEIANPAGVMPAQFADNFEVQVISAEGGPRLVAAIELVSPSNKDRPQARRAFASKCANFACMIIDVVTSRHANLDNEIIDLLLIENCRIAEPGALYATAYHPIRRETREEIDAWHEPVRVGETLPRLPLFLDAEFSMPVDFEKSYHETCGRLRLVA